MHTRVFPNSHAATGVLPVEVGIIEPYIMMKLCWGGICSWEDAVFFLERAHLLTSLRICGRWAMGKKSTVCHILCYMLSQYHIAIFSVSPRALAMKSDYILRSQASLENK